MSGGQQVASLEDEARRLLNVDAAEEPLQLCRHAAGGACRRGAWAPLLVGAAAFAALVALRPGAAPAGEQRHGHNGVDIEGKSAYEYVTKAYANDYDAYAGEGIDDDCGNSPQLNDFSSKRGMESAGWWFNWTDDFTFKPLMYKDFVPPYSYWGFMMHGSGAISLRVKGEGDLTLDFGNLLGTPGSQVSVYLNLEKKATAGPSMLSKTVEMQFHPEDALTIVQDGPGIIVLNRISFKCLVTTTPQLISTSSEYEDPIKKAEELWKKEHAALQKAAEAAEKKQQEHYAALKLQKAQQKIMERDRKEEEELEKEEKQDKEKAKKDEESEEKENDRLVKALMDLLGQGDSGHFSALMDKDKDVTAKDELAKAKEEEEIAKKLEQVAKSDRLGRVQDLAAAKRLRQKAKEEREKSKQRLAKEKNITDVKKNETWAKQLAEAAKRQAERTEKELKEAEEEEDRQAKESAKAAALMKDVLRKQREKDAGSSKEKMKQLEMQKEKERERMRMKGKEAAAAAELAKSMIGSTKPTTHHIHGLGTSLYCYCLMLPFGYEPNLLAAQKVKKVGIFECDAYTIFSNSTVLLDTGEPSPVEIELLDFSLAVPYGGKWHTALNTPVFNKIWTKVMNMGIYLKHDWVVKADPDTVWFPTRLTALIERGLPHEIYEANARRLNYEAKTKITHSCGHCQMHGAQADTCDAHVQWLQKNKNYSCNEALRQTSRPPPIDCGCNCTRLEACDLSEDPDWRQDGHYIMGSGNGVKAAIYINNCRFGLHGPIEVLSSGAVTAYVKGLPECEYLENIPWGEDKWLDRCMLSIGVTRVNVFGMLSEIACGEEPAPCGSTNVAFHPFKKFEEYFACWAFAHSFGHGPADGDKGLELAKDGKSFI